MTPEERWDRPVHGALLVLIARPKIMASSAAMNIQHLKAKRQLTRIQIFDGLLRQVKGFGKLKLIIKEARPGFATIVQTIAVCPRVDPEHFACYYIRR